MGEAFRLGIERAANFYGISFEEGLRRYERIVAAGDDPAKPICIGCAQTPEELDEYDILLDTEPVPDGHEPILTRTEAVIREEGTYNPSNGHFFCTPCYIKNGQPSSPGGWKAP